MTFKLFSLECDDCGSRSKELRWDYNPIATCSCGGTRYESSFTLKPNRGVIDDQIEGGPRVFETMGPEGVYIESKSQWRREVEARNLVNVVRHDTSYYVKQRKMHDEKMRDERV